MSRRRGREPGTQLASEQLRELLRVLHEGGVSVFRYEDADIKLEIERGAQREEPERSPERDPAG
jgi:hypothetical protein